MKLYDYLLKNEILPNEFAKEIGLQPQTIYRIISGLSPTLVNASKIVKKTGGYVSFEDLLSSKPRKRRLKPLKMVKHAGISIAE